MAGPPPLPLTYTDAVCGLDVDPLGRETGSDLENLVQDVFHVLLQALGSNPDDPDRGLGIEAVLNASDTAARTISGRVDRELDKDTRISSSSTSFSEQPDGSYLISIRIQVGDTVLPLDFSFDSQSGLNFLGNQGLSS